MTDLQNMDAQWFPQYFPMGPVAFNAGANQQSGAAGATARLSKDIPNWALAFLGVRITNAYELPESPSEQDIRIYTACKQWVDAEQTVEIKLAQQNVVADPIPQSHLTGNPGGFYWSPFPVPYPMAGGNNVVVQIVRSTGYPNLESGPINPVVNVSMICAVAKGGPQTIPPHRVNRPQML